MFDMQTDVDPLVAALLSNRPATRKPQLQAFNAAPIDATEAQLATGAAINPMTALPAVAAILRNNRARSEATELTRAYNDAMLQAMRPDPNASTDAFFAEALKHEYMQPVVLDYMRQRHMPVSEDAYNMALNAYNAKNYTKPTAEATGNVYSALDRAVDSGYRPDSVENFYLHGTGQAPIPPFTRVPSKNEISAENGRLHADALRGSVSHTQDASTTQEFPVARTDPRIGGAVIGKETVKSGTTDKADLKGAVPTGATAPASPSASIRDPSAEDRVLSQLVNGFTSRGITGVVPTLDPALSKNGKRVYHIYDASGKQIAPDFVYTPQ